MSEWKTVKKASTKKREKYIRNFWEIDDEGYLDPSTFTEYSKKTRQQISIDIQECIPGNRYFSQLADLKKRLMEEKSKLDVYNVINWSKHTNFTYLYSELTKMLRFDYKIDLCTTAWTKMWEILVRFLPDLHKEKSLRALYLCEGPGSFITCTNHYLKTKYGPDFNFEWSAITLADHDNGLFDKYWGTWVPNNWFFGPDGTGDITNPNNIINGIWGRHLADVNKCDLVTADGSINCQHDPNNQELIVCPLKYAEITAMLKSLKIGGTFVIKYFTLFEPQTVCQLWLLANLFRKINIIKPVTSKPGNSEVYIVCTDYNGISDADADLLVKSPPTSLIYSPDTIPKDFLNFLFSTMTSIVNRQSHVIEQNIDWFNNRYKMNAQKIYATKDFVSKEFIKKYGINVCI